MNKISVLVVDDSAVVREVLSRELGRTRDIEVVATAPDPFVARDKLLRYSPDVMTLDVEMPRMDGITFLQKVMAHRPIPTIVVSSLTPHGGDMAMEALDAGAVDVLCKPGAAYTIGDLVPILADQIRAAARVRPQAITTRASPSPPERRLALTRTTQCIVALGASTGGTQALERVLSSFPANCPGTVIAQHMPPEFTRSFAARLDRVCAMDVREAREGDAVVPGVALVAPGNYHMELRRDGARYHAILHQGERLHFQRPAVDCLFQSVATWAGRNCVAALLTGMGSDGAKGLLSILEAGGATIAQDQASSVVWGMPGEAVKLGAAQDILPLDKVAQKILDLASRDALAR
ncbi:MAG: chemotaxis response regulator protein-glutamate methylesterase [Fibrobacteria bacterium]|nr:chemotaxis response regulator protein-glutamate methylesterase [Fibrobacteria bacterium]